MIYHSVIDHGVTNHGASGDVIRVDGVTQAYQGDSLPALADVSMDVADGEVVAVMGPSGQRQVHAAQPHRRAGPADGRHGHRGLAAD